MIKRLMKKRMFGKIDSRDMTPGVRKSLWSHFMPCYVRFIELNFTTRNFPMFGKNEIK